MAEFGDIRQVLATALGTATGLQSYADEPDNVSVPCIVVRPGAPFAQYEQRMGNSVITTWRMDVFVLVGKLADKAAHIKLNAMVSPGPGGIVQVINNTRVDGVRYRTTQGLQYGPVQVGNATYLGTQLSVEITV